MNISTMTKLQAYIYGNQDNLEAILEAVEKVCEQSKPEAPKHPLLDYVVSEEDVGSLVSMWDSTRPDGLGYITVLTKVDTSRPCMIYANESAWWENATPVMEDIKLHFKPFVADEYGAIPSELIHAEWVALLFENGDVIVTQTPTSYSWKECVSVDIIGYRKLTFVNPVLGK